MRAAMLAIFLLPATPAAMVKIPQGETFIGCNKRVDKKCEPDEKPGRKVKVAAFFLDRTEVTVAMYRRCVLAGRCEAPGRKGACNWSIQNRENHPINCVRWAQARDYCTFVKKRLPTEHEWARAARGDDGRKYPWGNIEARLRANSRGAEDGFLNTAPVGRFPAGASPYGVLDMIGNVWEWTADWYEPEESRVMRGTSWFEAARLARVSNRGRNKPQAFGATIGFRCARTK